MSESLTLTKVEIVGLTKCVRFKAQTRHLRVMLGDAGAIVRNAPDGSPVVSRQAFEQAMGCKVDSATDKPVKLNLGFLRAS